MPASIRARYEFWRFLQWFWLYISKWFEWDCEKRLFSHFGTVHWTLKYVPAIQKNLSLSLCDHQWMKQEKGINGTNLSKRKNEKKNQFHFALIFIINIASRTRFCHLFGFNWTTKAAFSTLFTIISVFWLNLSHNYSVNHTKNFSSLFKYHFHFISFVINSRILLWNLIWSHWLY